MSGIPQASIVIRTSNSLTNVGRALRAVRAQQHSSYELVLVDSQSTDGTVALGERHGARIVSLRPEDFTFGHALNLGCKASRGDLVVLLSSDATPASDQWLRELLAPFDDPAVGGTYGRQLPYPGCDPITARDLATAYGTAPRRQDSDPRFAASNGAIRRALWRRHPFRTDLPCSEDFDWARRIQGDGHVIEYVPSAPVYHSHFSSLVGIYRRFYQEAAGLRLSVPGARTSLASFLRDWQARTREDWVHLFRSGAAWHWFGWVPAYRFCRSLGLHRSTWYSTTRG